MKPTIDQQRAILATLILQPGRYYRIAEYLAPQMFAAPIRSLADYVLSRCSDGAGFDVPTLNDQFTAKAVSEILNYATSSDLLPAHAIQVRDSYLAAEQVKMWHEAAARVGCGEEDFFQATARLESETSLLKTLYTGTTNRLDTIAAVRERMFLSLNNPDQIIGTPSGFDDLDEATGGWQPGDLVYIAARPNMGKTTIMCEMALAAALAGTPVGFFSMGDMTAAQLIGKMCAMLANVEYKELRRRNITKDQKERLAASFDTIADLPIHVLDNRDVSNQVGAIRDRARALVEREGVGLVVVDYVQQVAADTRQGSRNDEMGEVSRGLKSLAVQNNIPCLAGCQLSRAPETRGGTKRPQMSDLRDSGNLEQDADQVFFIYRPEYYGITEDENGGSLKGITEFITGKDRMAGDMVGTTYQWHYYNARIVTAATKKSDWNAALVDYTMPRANTETEVPF